MPLPLAVLVTEAVLHDKLIFPVIVTVGGATICKPVTATLAGERQLPTVQVAVILYVPTLERIKLVPDEPFDQLTVPAQPLAVKASVLGEQTTLVAGAVIVGAEGCATICKPVTATLAGEIQDPTVQVAVIL